MGLGEDSHKRLKADIVIERVIMNKARLEWVMSGLNQYALTTAEDIFLRTASADFDKNQVLTERQEARLETLYKEKSRLLPNKKIDHTPKKSSSKKIRTRRPRVRVF